MATLEQIIDEARALSPAEKLKLRQALDHELEQAMPAQSRAMESTWVERHRDKYLGQWVALVRSLLRNSIQIPLPLVAAL